MPKPRYVILPAGFGAVVADRGLRGASEIYTDVEAQYLLEWLNERSAGYPHLARFEGGNDWPTDHGTPRPVPPS
jgi:hypothetical protein